jgi:hypothetical protein
MGVRRQITKQALSSPRFGSKTLPAVLLAGLLVAGFITIFTQAARYGIAWDETFQDRYGAVALRYYTTLGRDTSFLASPGSGQNEPEHGAIFEIGVAAAQSALPGVDHWYLRHLLTALVGLAGIGAIALCGFEIGGYWVAFLAALGLWLYPRYYGAIYDNSKDIPAAVTFTLVLWAALLLIRQWGNQEHPQRYLRNSALVGALLGLAAAIRVNALIWYAILAIYLAGWWLIHGRRAWREERVRAEALKQGRAAGVIAALSLVIMVVLWPYLLLNPIVNLLHAVDVISRYPWPGLTLYNGRLYTATNLPADYLFTWLVIGSSLTLVAMAALGLGVVAVTSTQARRVDPRLALILIAFVAPLLTMLALRSVVYDGLRQVLFLVPLLILIGAYGLARVFGALARADRVALKAVAAGLGALAVLSYSLDVLTMRALSPYEYAYFSPLIGGIAGAQGKFDTEYWATCSKQSAEWLASHYQEYTSAAAPSVQANPTTELVSPYLPAAFRHDNTHPDFYIAPTRFGYELRFPTYVSIHVVTADGVPICIVKMNPAAAPR